MNLQIVFTLTLMVLVTEGSLKKDVPVDGKDVLIIVQSAPNPSSKQDKNQPVITDKVIQNTNTQDQDASSSESTSKVARHLLSEKNIKRLKMNRIKKPWFSSKISDSPVLRILKKIQGKPDQVGPVGELMRYAPRSLDTLGVGGLINYNNLERFYGNQPIAPTSGSPNSLDHLFLPEFHAKDYMKPLDFNGINNHFPNQDVNNAYADGYGYGSKPNNFRGNPIDINFQHEHDLGGVTNTGPSDLTNGPSLVEHPNIPRGEYPHHSTSTTPHSETSAEANYQHRTIPQHGRGPPPPHHHIEDPHRNQNSPSSDHDRHPSSQNRPLRGPNEKPSNPGPPGPDFSNEVEGDGTGGLWSIVDLAHMLQNTAGLQNQLAGVNGNNAEPERPSDKNRHPNDNHFRGPGTDGGERTQGINNFDESRPDGHRGNFNRNYDGPESDRGQRDPHNNFNGQKSEAVHGSGGNNRFENLGPGHGGEDGHLNNYDKQNADGYRGRGQHNRYDSSVGQDHERRNQYNDYYDRKSLNGNREQFNNNQYDDPSGHGAGQGSGDSFRDSHPNNFPDDFSSENPDRHYSGQRPQRPLRKPQYGNGGGFEDESSSYNSYNSQEQFDGPRRPQHTNPGQGVEHGDENYYDS